MNNNRLSKRISKENYYLSLAQEGAKRGTCLRRNYGAVIVKNDEVISTGYTGAPRGQINCIDIDRCLRNDLNIPSGEKYELCRSVHAEMNACIHASRRDMIDSTLYLCGLDKETGKIVGSEPCKLCQRVIINSGIVKVIVKDSDEFFTTLLVENWVI